MIPHPARSRSLARRQKDGTSSWAVILASVRFGFIALSAALILHHLCSARVTTSSYDQAVLADHPVAFWAMNSKADTEPDLTRHQNSGKYLGGLPEHTQMPNGDTAALFNGSGEYLTIPSKPSFSITTTGSLTWEIWLKPTVLQFPASSGGYVDFIGKCANYSPTCEWEGRLYNTTNSQGRCNRLSAYVFNPGAGLGSAADWQPLCGLLRPAQWLHVVAEYTLLDQPAKCPNAANFPGSIDIWVNGVKWNQAAHNPTGCMSQYRVKPQALNSPVNIATMATHTGRPTWFEGAIGKVALYDYRLTQAQINSHYKAMTAKQPTGSCGSTCTF